MNVLYLTPDLVKKTYTYKAKKRALGAAIAIFALLLTLCGFPMAFAISLCKGNSDDRGVLICFSVLFFVIFFFIFLYFAQSFRAMKKNPEDYALYYADISDYKVFSQRSGRYSSSLHLRVDFSFETPSGKFVHKVVDYPLDSEISNFKKIEKLKIKVGYDEKLDRTLVLTDLSDIFNKDDDDCEEKTFFDFFDR